ncbi:MAG TPA: cupredoxin domain-containing protein [Gemmatimonadales bacterium]|nr:cupredoxin domain-containing protein [Gemmatimonadales bacterium]
MTLRGWALLAVVGSVAACKSSTAAGTAHTLTVSVRDNVFSPQVDSISVGDSVAFTWQGSQLHDLIFQDSVHIANVSTPQNSGSVKRGFASAGIYKFRCTFHSTDFNTGIMVGTIAAY